MLKVSHSSPISSVEIVAERRLKMNQTENYTVGFFRLYCHLSFANFLISYVLRFFKE